MSETWHLRHCTVVFLFLNVSKLVLKCNIPVMFLSLFSVFSEFFVVSTRNWPGSRSCLVCVCLGHFSYVHDVYFMFLESGLDSVTFCGVRKAF